MMQEEKDFLDLEDVEDIPWHDGGLLGKGLEVLDCAVDPAI